VYDLPFIVPLSAPEATNADRFGPKAANLARLGREGLPIPDGFCVAAEAYRIQVTALDLGNFARDVSSAETGVARRAALDARARASIDHRAGTARSTADGWRALVKRTGTTVVRSSALVEDRFGSSFAG
jgi:pyruvate,water dikinase